jgi:hypothetical protein
MLKENKKLHIIHVNGPLPIEPYDPVWGVGISGLTENLLVSGINRG